MLVLALDTTTRGGSVALARDGALERAFAGDAARTHAARLPGDILAVLAHQRATLADIDLFAVAAGPGSFTGLRIGIATIQGLAFANQRPAVAVSALEALAHSAGEAGEGLIGVWMDARRGEVYAELFRAGTREAVRPAVVNEPSAVLEGWSDLLANRQGEGLLLLGDGAITYRHFVAARLPRAAIVTDVPMLAPAIARLATRAAEQGLAGPPHAIRPLYVRRPDAELARERSRSHAVTREEGHDPHG